jgi:hypothetical protein
MGVQSEMQAELDQAEEQERFDAEMAETQRELGEARDERAARDEPVPEPEVPVRAAAGIQTYVVQKQDRMDTAAWHDVATVAVPARTKRRSIIEKALAINGDAATDLTATPQFFRVLDTRSSQAVPVTLEAPATPQLKIG